MSYNIDTGGAYYGTSNIQHSYGRIIKKQFDSLCSDFGMTASTAINVLQELLFVKEKFRLKYLHQSRKSQKKVP